MRRFGKILKIIFWIIFFLGMFYTYSKIKYIKKSAYNNTDLILEDFNIRKSDFYENNIKEEQKQEKIEENEDRSEADKEVDKIIKEHLDNKNGN
ncbi:hypothetical protein [Streptobacillus moniliformis]|uniref:hypothetical protein n=1 Tax=Streptobacillus moniliformis TaxID=34105 RepID=UPI0007E3D875|nr:hypothetical protein [Streptobacillus moniliformis]